MPLINRSKLYTNRFIWILALGLVFSGLLVATVSAQETRPSDDEVNAIAKGLYCPVCENTPLDVCPTLACQAWREEIRNMLAEGKSEAEIRQHFLDYYGARVLSEPPLVGFYWLVYVVPPILILAGAIMLFRKLRAWNPSSSTEPSLAEDDTQTSEDEYIARMEADLKKRS